jgi:cobalt-precorrin 5A hydrolase/precorrin-3B C17-methyltransferase
VIALVAATARGTQLAEALAPSLPDAELFRERPRQAVARGFAEADALVCFMATGVAVRLAASHLRDKHSDPAVVCVDDGARYVVALCGGHEGGANELAERVAGLLGAEPVVTTASDRLGLPALGSLGSEHGLKLAPGSDVAAVASALVSGIPVELWADVQVPLGPLAPGVVAVEELPRTGPLIAITDRLVELPAPHVLYRPESLVVGIGASRGCAREELVDLVDRTLDHARLSADSVAGFASIDLKADEPALIALGASQRRPLTFFAAEELAAVSAPNPSEVVRRAVGTPSVAEAAALLGANAPRLLVEKRTSPHATMAVARRRPRGILRLVSLGPGHPDLMTRSASEAIRSSSLVVGYRGYTEPLRSSLAPGTELVGYELGEELDRCRHAAREAARGRSVALVSSGDVGVYAMASPAFADTDLAEVDVEVIPGVTAAQAAAARLGSPLGHDWCSISLSDLLTPWDAIERRIEAAAEGDFVVCFYNPSSRTRDWQLAAALRILGERRSATTPAAIVEQAYRDGEQLTLTTLSELDPRNATMTSIVVVGSTQTEYVDGRMVTPRGYARKAAPA